MTEELMIEAFQHALPGLEDTMMVISALGLAAAAAGPLKLGLKRPEGRALAGLLGFTAVFVSLLQGMIFRLRPDGDVIWWGPIPFASFPSGHAALVFALAAFVSLPRPRLRLPLFLFATLVALSRVYLGRHFPSDVIIGAALGTGFGMAAHGFFRRPPGRPRWGWWFPVVVAGVLVLGTVGQLQLMQVNKAFFAHADKAIHFGGFGTLAFMSVGWFWKQPARRILLVLIVLVTIDEGLQGLSPHRRVDIWDEVASVSGILLLGGAAAWLRSGRFLGLKVLSRGWGRCETPRRPDESAPAANPS